MTYKRLIFKDILKRFQESRRFIQVLFGARQVGKTTLANQLIAEIHCPTHYATADQPTLKGLAWIEAQWQIARAKLKENQAVLLVLDEIQKIPNWSEAVKRLWDEDTQYHKNLKILLLGSAPLLIQQGLTETLAGRFEIMRIPHWSFREMQDAFNFSLENFLYFGGYPGAAELIEQTDRWRRYVQDALIETTISRDVLLMKRIHKPALLRQLFQLGCDYSGQILSYQKMLGQLHDAGNTTTLAHYLEILSHCGLITGLNKYAGKAIVKRAASPKLQVLNTGLMNAMQTRSPKEAKADLTYYGRVVESAVGAYLLNETFGTDIKLSYWRENNAEVDFILERGDQVIALEVKSQKNKQSVPGLSMFAQKYPKATLLVIGADGLSLETFLKAPLGF